MDIDAPKVTTLGSMAHASALRSSARMLRTQTSGDPHDLESFTVAAERLDILADNMDHPVTIESLRKALAGLESQAKHERYLRVQAEERLARTIEEGNTSR